MAFYNDMIPQNFEPKRAFRWVIEYEGLDTFLAQTATRPKITVGETEFNFLNFVSYFAGKARPETFTISLVDAIDPSQVKKAFDWMSTVYNFNTGKAHGKDFYAKDIVLKLLGPEGEIIEKWTLKNAWPVNFNPSDLDYNSEEFATVELTLRYDKAVLEEI